MEGSMTGNMNHGTSCIHVVFNVRGKCIPQTTTYIKSASNKNNFSIQNKLNVQIRR